MFTYPLPNAGAVTGITKQYISCSLFILLSSFAHRHKEQQKWKEKKRNFVGSRRFHHDMARYQHSRSSLSAQLPAVVYRASPKKVMFVNFPSSHQPIIISCSLSTSIHFRDCAQYAQAMCCGMVHVKLYLLNNTCLCWHDYMRLSYP